LLPQNLFIVLKEMGKFLILSDAMQTKTEVIHLNTIGQVIIYVLTWSKNSGSVAEASHRLFKMKMFGFESRVETLWKKFFS
jgi:hypothetical protein